CKTRILCLSKCDLLSESERRRVAHQSIDGNPPLLISAVTGEGIPTLLYRIWEALQQVRHASNSPAAVPISP
ncbi:MAG: hypothetical protein NZ949_00930, partial [Candidatus Kapabacteria bacterium]|nr:hypothetical protein [Candidatus Kapabacteria bacterium]